MEKRGGEGGTPFLPPLLTSTHAERRAARDARLEGRARRRCPSRAGRSECRAVPAQVIKYQVQSTKYKVPAQVTAAANKLKTRAFDDVLGARLAVAQFE